MLLILAAVVLLGLAALWWASTQIGRVEVTDLTSTSGPIHILVAGSDTREGLSPEEQRELGTGDVGGDRTDTIFVMTIHRGEVALLAFPRDLWVPRCDGSVGRINSAVAVGGPGCLVRTVRDLSGIDINHFVEVTFSGFRRVVDAVGGVELCLEEPISDRDAHIDLPAGCQVLDGADALGYVRVRKIDNDLMRIQRQQRFVQALAQEVTSAGTLFNPIRLGAFIRDAGDAVRVDQTMGPITMVRLGLAGRGIASGSMATHTVPVDPHTTSGGAQVLLVRSAEAEPLFASFRNGSVLGSDPERIDPADVAVRVLNGAQVEGLAASVADRLATEGFDVQEIGNADARDTTVISYPSGQEQQAQLVSNHVPGAGTIEEDAGIPLITVVLGRDAAP